MLKHTDDARGRVADGVRKYSRIVAMARERGMNCRDTSDIVKAMLADMLGYDPFFEVTADASVTGPHADFAVLTEGRLQFLLSVKGIAVTPSVAHLMRLSGASAPAYADWIVVTNADTWACYRLGVGHDRHPELVFRASLLDPTDNETKAMLFCHLTREGVLQGALGSYWEQVRVLHRGRLSALLLSDPVISVLQREIQRTANYRVDRQTLYELLTHDVIRPEALAARHSEELPATLLPHCFAYAPDPGDARTWRVRYRNQDGTPNAEMLVLAVSDLRGDLRAMGIPGDDVPLVKQRLRQAYMELGLSLEELPDVLRPA